MKTIDVYFVALSKYKEILSIVAGPFWDQCDATDKRDEMNKLLVNSKCSYEVVSSNLQIEVLE